MNSHSSDLDNDPKYHHIPGRSQSEGEKRWLSWSILTAAGVRKSYKGTVSRAEAAARHKKAKAGRKAARKNR